MSATVSTDFLLLVAQATPEQQAAIERFLRGGVLREATEESESDARRVFSLMKRLEGGPRQWKAPLATVFRLVVLEGRSQGKTARLCDCVPALISRRVKTIESRFGMSIEQLRSFASTILEMEASVKGDRYRRRKTGPPADESAQYDDGRRRPGLAEDDDGYLPEERQEEDG